MGADGAQFELPEAMVDVLRQVCHRVGVTVAPMNAMLITQEAPTPGDRPPDAGADSGAG